VPQRAETRHGNRRSTAEGRRSPVWAKMPLLSHSDRASRRAPCASLRGGPAATAKSPSTLARVRLIAWCRDAAVKSSLTPARWRTATVPRRRFPTGRDRLVCSGSGSRRVDFGAWPRHSRQAALPANGIVQRPRQSPTVVVRGDPRRTGPGQVVAWGKSTVCSVDAFGYQIPLDDRFEQAYPFLFGRSVMPRYPHRSDRRGKVVKASTGRGVRSGSVDEAYSAEAPPGKNKRVLNQGANDLSS
jgi:hypothetical protein